MHLYIHIPFCKQACHYCDFHFSTNMGQKSALVDALCTEIRMQHLYLPTPNLETIYFGGGTPSLLTEAELAQIFETIHTYFTVSPSAEITLEANPDDLSAEKLRMLRQYVNRLSIGIQTFDEATLHWMNRAHTATEAENCVRLAREAGFENLSVDLIYGIPNRDQSRWQLDLQKIRALDVPHLSAYALTIEPDTAFGRWQQKGKLPPADEAIAAEQFEELTQALTQAGYAHYEISNFARSGQDQTVQYARHNTAYWQRKPYLGIGPSAHSYNGHSRQYNIANNVRYIADIRQGKLPAEVEELTIADQVNDYLLTGLRTQWGCSLTELNGLLRTDFENQQASDLAAMYASGWLIREGDRLRLTNAGKLFADRVAATLFVE
ncbi:radical SAM family heme chaperone HemW [Spirosoma sp. KCTC 42546]|uniref:radical SAM family heme chaperone HemW n=1 Tax=Spirosoma sp. KCTC 42546 TaxID=2520506 RepID=UPI00115B4608|nr:radical SAM family heme chaperone HemW [Spirosoma sp. KCTC 42546]QDK80656.1 radical SAM family heme chaperone HemW [Spirosoma sp. KCTC 42546]